MRAIKITHTQSMTSLSSCKIYKREREERWTNKDGPKSDKYIVFSTSSFILVIIYIFLFSSPSLRFKKEEKKKNFEVMFKGGLALVCHLYDSFHLAQAPPSKTAHERNSKQACKVVSHGSKKAPPSV